MAPARQPAVADTATAGFRLPEGDLPPHLHAGQTVLPQAVPAQRQPRHDQLTIAPVAPAFPLPLAPPPAVPGRHSRRQQTASRSAAGAAARPTARHRATRSRRFSRKRLLWGLLLLLLLVVAAGARIAWNAAAAQRESATAMAQLGAVQMNLTNGDLPSAELALADMQRSTRLAAEATSGPLWRVASAIPFAGNSLRTFTGLTRAGDDAARTGLPALLEAAGALQPETFLRPDGGLDASALLNAREPLTRATTSLSRARADIATLPDTGLIGPVAEGRTTLSSSLDLALKTLHNTDVGARLAPRMLGADGPRRYLVTLTTPAQRPGAPGAFVLVDVSAGTPQVVSSGTGTVAGVQAQTGVLIDGVVRLNAEGLAAVLRSTGPVVTPGGLSVDAETVVAALSGSTADAFPTPAARAAFPGQALEASTSALLTTPTAWSMYLLQDLGAQSATGSLQLTSVHADEQALLATTTLSRAAG